MKKFLLYMLGSVLLGSCAQESFIDTPPNSETAVVRGTSFNEQGIPGVAHVKVKNDILSEIKKISPYGVTLQSAPSLLANTLHDIQATDLRPLFRIDPRFEERMRREGLDCWYEIKFDQKQDLQQTLTSLSQSKLFTIVEPVFATSIPEVKMGSTFSLEVPTATDDEQDVPFNDPLLLKQWHYKNFGTTSKSVAGADINLFEAWKTETGKPNVIVAIVDGGIDVTHEDLVDNLWINEGEIPGNGIDDDGNGYIDDVYGWNFVSNKSEITLDEAGHGTHVAGTVAARNNNGIGVGGVAGGDGTPGSGARLMSCQKFEDDLGVTAEEAYVYSANNGAVISQNSWGYTYPGPGYLPSSIKTAIDYFIKYAGCDNDGNQLPDSPMKGGVVIFAAGNDGEDYLSYPGAYEATIAVSAMAPDWKSAYYTNRGDWVDIMAPGGDEFYPSGMVYSTLPEAIYGTGRNYGYMQGTSMACPHVSGIAALVVSHFGGQGFTNEDLKARLLGSLRPENINVHNPEYAGRLGVGYIDAAHTFDINQNKKPNDVTDVTAQPGYTTIQLSWNAVTDEDDGTPIKYQVYYSDQVMTASNYKSKSSLTVNAMGTTPGEKIDCTVTGLKENSTYYVTVIAVDRWGLESGFKLFSFSTLKNDPPVIEDVPETPVRVSGVEKQQFSVGISDPNGHNLTFKLSGETRGVSATKNGNALDFTIRAVAPVSDTPYEVILTVTDELGASTTATIQFVVYKYQAPAIINSFQELLSTPNSKQDYDLNQYFTGSDLSFTAESSNEEVVVASIQGTTLSVTAKKKGEATVTVTASTGRESLQSTMSVRIVENTDELVYQVYPLPATTQLNILLNPIITKADVSIRTLLGEEVFNNLYNVTKLEPININVQRLAAGTYTLVVKTSKGTYKKTFVKQ